MPTPFQRSEKTQRLISYLKMLDKGATVTYLELSQAAGVPVTASDGHLTTARRVLLRDHNSVWKSSGRRSASSG
jgi:hypothetical protein